ncbi:MAG TPA: KEOPS complex kinase/ATPase Bud32 [Methanomassiliicoccaceae archaeon]|mgnify:CR=1 FL=1|nr:KEOPS complex kinase/ATPase Bud32 [Methanomassiliicoccaceae archaeon]
MLCSIVLFIVLSDDDDPSAADARSQGTELSMERSMSCHHVICLELKVKDLVPFSEKVIYRLFIARGMDIIQRGAEAEIRRGKWLGRDVIIKSRVPKSYRLPEMDRSLRNMRTRNEARLIHEAREAGVPTPIIYDIDTVNAEMTMEFIDGLRVKDELGRSAPDEVRDLLREMGRSIAYLHRCGIVHGDLTTSNMIMSKGRMWFIDFSLGSRCASVEEMGVDIHLLKESFQSAHPELLDRFHIILESYKENFERADEIVRKAKEIGSRGRYT